MSVKPFSIPHAATNLKSINAFRCHFNLASSAKEIYGLNQKQYGLLKKFYSPEGFRIAAPIFTGSPKAGVPSAFQLNF